MISILIVQYFIFLALLFLDEIIAFCLAIYILLIQVSTFLIACFSTFFNTCFFIKVFFSSVFYIFYTITSIFLIAAYTFLVLAVIIAFFSIIAITLVFFLKKNFQVTIDLIGLFISGLFKLVAKKFICIVE